MGKFKASITGAAIGAAKAGIKAARSGGSGKEITQAAVGGAGVPSFGGRRDKIVGKAYDATTQGISKAAPIVKGAVSNVTGRLGEMMHGLGSGNSDA